MPAGEPVVKPPEYNPDTFWNARLEKDFSLAGVGHAGVGLAFNRWAYAVRRRVLLRHMQAHGIAIQGARILELGFGTGFYLDLWRAHGAAHVTAFDIAQVATEAARCRFAPDGWRIEQADIGRPLDLGAARGACDLAAAFDVLFHLVDETAWHGALDNLAAALRPGGHLLVFEKLQRTESGKSHVRRRTLAAYREALAARGLDVLAVRPIFFWMNSPTDASGMAGFFFRSAWSLAKLPYRAGRLAGLGETFGWLSGATLFGPELLAGRLFSTGPSTKLLIARRKA